MHHDGKGFIIHCRYHSSTVQDVAYGATGCVFNVGSMFHIGRRSIVQWNLSIATT